MRATKLTARGLAYVLRPIGRKIAKAYRARQTPHGKQSVKKLMAHGAATNSVEIEAPKLFDRAARKWGIDYAFYKTGPDKYLLFFKSSQADAMTACFSEYSRMVLNKAKSNRLPIREQLKQAAEALAREGQLGEAVKPLNTLRNARGLADYDLTGKTQEQLIGDILLERRRELWGEGFGITDILRTQRAVAREALTKEEAEKKYDCWQQDGSYKEYNPEGHWFTSFPDGTRFVPNSTYYLYSIPEKETNANPNL